MSASSWHRAQEGHYRQPGVRACPRCGHASQGERTIAGLGPRRDLCGPCYLGKPVGWWDGWGVTRAAIVATHAREDPFMQRNIKASAIAAAVGAAILAMDAFLDVGVVVYQAIQSIEAGVRP